MSYKYSVESDASRSEKPGSYTSEETVIRETTTRSVPMHVDTSIPLTSRFDDFLLEPISLSRGGFSEPLPSFTQPRALSSLPAGQPRVHFEPMTVRWDYYTPDTITPERQLQRMDRDFERLAGEMNRLYTQSRMAPVPASTAGAYYPTQERMYPTAVERVLNQSAPYTGTGLPNYEPPRGFVRVSPTHAGGSDIFPRSSEAQLWGANAHADSWRKRENFHLDNPVIKSRDGRSQFRLDFDLRQFNPEEIQVLTDDTTRMLTVQAKHEESTAGRKARREYFRQCTIPHDVEPRSIVSKLTKPGILTVYAPLIELEEGVKDAGSSEMAIKIKHTEH